MFVCLYVNLLCLLLFKGVDALKEDLIELQQGIKSITKTTVYTIESIWYAPESLEEKSLVLKDLFADHKGKWISWILLGTIFIA